MIQSGIISYSAISLRDRVDHMKVPALAQKSQNKKAISTRVSRAVPHLSTNLALSHLTSEFGWDPVHLA